MVFFSLEFSLNFRLINSRVSMAGDGQNGARKMRKQPCKNKYRLPPVCLVWLMGRCGKAIPVKFSNFIVACHKYARLGQHLTKDLVERPSAQTAFWYAIGCSACWFYGESILRLVFFFFFNFVTLWSRPGRNTAQEILVYQWNIVKSVYLRDFYIYYRFQCNL